MAGLSTTANVQSPDDVYQLFIDMHQGCTEEESHRRNAKLIMTLANHIGDEGVIREAVALVMASASPHEAQS